MSANVQDPERLLRRVAKGDLAAFDELYRRTAPTLAVRLRRRCSDDGLVAEVLQDTYLTVWRALLGARLAWAAPIAWVALQAMLAAPGGPVWRQSLFWLIQPVGSSPAAITAGVLLLAGVLAYAARVSPPDEAALA